MHQDDLKPLPTRVDTRKYLQYCQLTERKNPQQQQKQKNPQATMASHLGTKAEAAKKAR